MDIGFSVSFQFSHTTFGSRPLFQIKIAHNPNTPMLFRFGLRKQNISCRHYLLLQSYHYLFWQYAKFARISIIIISSYLTSNQYFYWFGSTQILFLYWFGSTQICSLKIFDVTYCKMPLSYRNIFWQFAKFAHRTRF